MTPRWTPTLDDFVDLACVILNASPDAVRRLPRIALAESALHAPFASFAGESAYPTLIEQAATLVSHIARNHPLPDGNKRTAFFLIGLFLEANGSPLRGTEPDIDVPIVERIAAGEVDHREIVAWSGRSTGLAASRNARAAGRVDVRQAAALLEFDPAWPAPCMSTRAAR